MPVLPASLLHAGSEAPLACRRPSEEKLAALALPISAERGEPHPRGPRQELYVGEIRDALMRHGPRARPCRGQATLLRGPRGLFPAQAGVAPPKARWARHQPRTGTVHKGLGQDMPRRRVEEAGTRAR